MQVRQLDSVSEQLLQFAVPSLKNPDLHVKHVVSSHVRQFSLKRKQDSQKAGLPAAPPSTASSAGLKWKLTLHSVQTVSVHSLQPLSLQRVHSSPFG